MYDINIVDKKTLQPYGKRVCFLYNINNNNYNDNNNNYYYGNNNNDDNNKKNIIKINMYF